MAEVLTTSNKAQATVSNWNGDGHPGPEVGTEEYLDSALQLQATMDGQRNRIVSRGLTPTTKPSTPRRLMGLGLAYDKADNRAFDHRVPLL